MLNPFPVKVFLQATYDCIQNGKSPMLECPRHLHVVDIFNPASSPFQNKHISREKFPVSTPSLPTIGDPIFLFWNLLLIHIRNCKTRNLVCVTPTLLVKA